MAAYPCSYLARLFNMRPEELDRWALSFRGRDSLKGFDHETGESQLSGPLCAAEFAPHLIPYLSTGGR